MRRRIFWILAMLMIVCRGFADIPDDFDMYLLIGQSNMAGRGPLEASDTTDVIDGVWLQSFRPQLNWSRIVNM